MFSISPPKENNNGDYPSITVHPTKNIAVCAYEGAVSQSKYFRVGVVKHDKITWEEEIERGKGEYVRVGLFEKNRKVYIITVYKRVFWRGCCYQINELLSDNSIKFGKSHMFCKGVRPSLAVRKDGTVIVVAEERLSYTLRCYMGKINDSVSEITWKLCPDVIHHGTTPSVAINDTHIILLYRIRASNSLKYACGCLTNTVEWKVLSQDFCAGIRPNVTLNNHQVVITTHMSFTGRSLYFGHGTLNDQGFTVRGESSKLGLGMHPALCLSDENKIIEIHRSNTGTHLWVSQGIWSPDSTPHVKEVEEPSYKVYDPMTVEYRMSLNKIELSFGSIEPQRREGANRAASAGDHYQMDQFPHGTALIINNKMFTSEKDTRDGTEIDEQNLITVFQYLGYCVHVFNDCTANQINKIMERMQMQDHTSHDSFICCILSHGGKDNVVSGSDNQHISVDDISKKLSPTNCPSLAKKPKIFFIQACRGHSQEHTVSVNTPDQQESLTATDNPSASGNSRNVSDQSDFYFAYATPSGYVAWRDPSNGSYYITELCRAIASHATYSSLAEIIAAANSQLSINFQKQGNNSKAVMQTIETLSRLSGKVYFL